MKPEVTNTYCEHPFRQVAAKNFNNNKLLEYAPCCQMTNQPHPKLLVDNSLTPQEAFDSPEFEKLRNDLSNNIRHPSCKTCWDMEDRGLTSFRLQSVDKFNLPLEFCKFDITTSHLCNLRCRMCSPTTSHSLKIDHKKMVENGDIELFEKSTNRGFKKRISKTIDISDIPQINWLYNNTDKIKVLEASGGEPFYDTKILSVLEKYVETGNSKNTYLHFHTNGTQFVKKHVVELNSQFKELHHVISIDGVDEVYEYIRYGSFEILEESLNNFFKGCKNIGILGINFVVSSINVLNIDKFIEWVELTFRNCEHHIMFSQIRPYGRGTSLYNLPIFILEEAKRRVKHFQILELIEDAIKNNVVDRTKMLNEILLMDKVRDQNFEILDPLLVEWLKNDTRFK